jgi:arabinogalactan oligomer/maltooligosaccharide transport system permease protein
MEISRKNPWRAIITRNGKAHAVKLLGGASQEDEIIAFGVSLKEGDLVRVVSASRNIGFNGLDYDEADAKEDEAGILIGASGEYDLHLSTRNFGNERLRILRPTPDSEVLRKTQRKNLAKMRTHAVKEETLTVLHNLFIAVLVFGWLIPVFWLILVSFTGDLHGPSLSQFFPQRWSGENYVKLFTVINDVNQFPRWFLNTLIVAICSTIVSTLFVLVTAFAFSRFRFKKRKGLMNLSMIIALFPGMLTMLVSYYLFEYVFKINSGLVRLIIAYSAASGLGYLVAKGFFDTIPTSIDEAAKLDGASSFTIFFKILVPLSKPIIIYTIITAFLSPWVDFVFAKIILGNSALPPEYTVAMGLINLISAGNILDWFGAFAAGSVIISIPLSILFLIVQKYYVGGVTGGAVKG